MARYSAFLGGINVGGHRASKEQLAEAATAIDCTEAVTYRASGNLIVETKLPRRKLEEALSKSLEKELGYAVPVFARTQKRVLELAAMEPFSAKQLKGSAGKLQILFLEKKPKAAAGKAALAEASDQDPLVLEGEELFWLPSGGLMESDLDLKAIEKAVGRSTKRTMGTIEGIAARISDTG